MERSLWDWKEAGRSRWGASENPVGGVARIGQPKRSLFAALRMICNEKMSMFRRC